ncbi:MAG: lamin tail domain-containing protein [candidate division WOR-3 bacterium]
MFLFSLLLIQQVVINEVMANPKGKTGPGSPEDRNEFVELYNNSQDTFNLLGWRISDFDAWDTIVSWRDSLILQKYPKLKINTTILPPKTYALILDLEYTQTGNGEYVMPYDFPESLIVLTVGNTTIGDELAMNDSLILYSPDSSITSTFSFPRPTKDGFSLERIHPTKPDSLENWIESLDSSGSTPGRENSSLTYINPEISNLMVRKKEKVSFSVRLKNPSYADCGYWEVRFRVNGAAIGKIVGESLEPKRETVLFFFPETLPSGRLEVKASLFCPKDKDTANNFLTVYFVNQREEILIFPPVFSPDNDGKDDSLYIYLSLTEGSDLTIEVFSLKGRKVKRIYQGKYEKSEEIFWDGRDDNGKLLPRGIYIITITYQMGREKRFIKKSCLLAGKTKR